MKKLSLLLSFLVCIALIFMPACKTAEEAFNIVGLWNYTCIYSDLEVYVGTFTFSGSATAGTVVDDGSGIGTYTVAGTAVNFNIAWNNGNSSNFIGSASTNNLMNGTFIEAWDWTGTWSCTR